MVTGAGTHHYDDDGDRWSKNNSDGRRLRVRAERWSPQRTGGQTEHPPTGCRPRLTLTHFSIHFLFISIVDKISDTCLFVTEQTALVISDNINKPKLSEVYIITIIHQGYNTITPPSTPPHTKEERTLPVGRLYGGPPQTHRPALACCGTESTTL